MLLNCHIERGGEKVANRGRSLEQKPDIEQIIMMYYEPIYRFCYWKIHDSAEAQDITQDTFERFLNAAQTYADIENPKALLYTIARNLCLNWHKKIHPISLDALEHSGELAINDFSDALIKDISLSTAISKLSNLQQEILLLRYGQDLKVNEISKILSLSRFQVMYRIRAALKELEKCLKEEGL